MSLIRSSRAALLTAALATALLLVGMPAAEAHDELVGSTPTSGSTVDAAPVAVQLEFGEEVQELGTRVVVTADDGTTVCDGPVEVDGATVAQPLTADLPPGTYTVDWQVTSADGHPVSDQFTFGVAGATTDVGEAAATSPAGSSATPWVVVGALLVLAVALAVAVRGLRRRS